MRNLNYELKQLCRRNRDGSDNDHYGIGNRQYVTNVSKARQLTGGELARITDPYTAMSLRLQAAFGLRRGESFKIRPEWADRGDRLALKDTWTKGGRPREIPIRNTEQRQVLDEAKALAGRGSLIPAERSYVEQLRRFEYQCAAAGAHRIHGHRHQGATASAATRAATCSASRRASWAGAHRRRPSRGHVASSRGLPAHRSNVQLHIWCIWVDSRQPGSPYAQDPALHTSHLALGRRQVRLQVPRKLSGPVGFTEPRRQREGVVLIGRAVIRGKCVLPKRRVGLDDGGLARGDRPTVEWPEVQAAAELLAQVQQPRDAGMGRLGHRALDVEMEH